jgi:predicted transposase YbfD/YdcC
MSQPTYASILTHFASLEDPRNERGKDHNLLDIVAIAICAVICGAESWVDMELYGQSKQEWLATFLALNTGIPSYDTFARVFARLDPQQMQACFLSWIEAISQLSGGEIIAIDGKTLRHSYDSTNSKGAIHMVSAWASANRLVLGQRKVDDKSNEIKAIPELLQLLAIEGCIVTIDASGMPEGDCSNHCRARRRLHPGTQGQSRRTV